MADVESDDAGMSSYAPEVNNDEDTEYIPESNDDNKDTFNGFDPTNEDQDTLNGLDTTTEPIYNQQEDLTIQEFTLLIILHPDNVRHRILVTASHTMAAVVDILCNDLRLQPEMITFPSLAANHNGWEETRVGEVLGMDTVTAALDPENDPPIEPVLQATVSRKPYTDEYVLPNQIQVQVFDGMHLKTYFNVFVSYRFI